MKRTLKKFLIVICCIVLISGICVGGFFVFYTPCLTADLSVTTGEVTTGASGYLYGIAQPGVPSENMTESIDISTVSQKVTGGLQHPVGDVDDISRQLESTDYIVVYLQDAYSTWYYEQSAIEEKRADGSYDWRSFITEDYFPKVEQAVRELSQTDYSGKIVYCLYNECDNGVWFGETMSSEGSEFGVYGAYNQQGEQNFFEAWKMTYELVKSISPDALIGGPGFCDYDSTEIKNFLSYCADNGCVPEIMIYHELSDYSVYFWQHHVRDYRQTEQSLGIDELPIIVTEYGRMQDNGMPGKMVQYITQIETSKVYADNAFWRLADNLCDVAADDNSPNSNWWLYRWYADMQGKTVSAEYHDLFRSNLENALKGKADYSSQGFMGVVTVSDSGDKIDIICGGRDGRADVKLKNTDAVGLKGRDVHVKIEEVLYKGISGVVTAPVTLGEYNVTASNTIKIDLDGMDEADAYHITVTAGSGEEYENESYIERYEFERGDILGGAYTYDSAYATTGEVNGMTGGMENEGDGVSIEIDVPEDGDYVLDFIYGNANDGAFDDSGKQNPDDRTFSAVTLDISINGGEVSYDLKLPNTIRSEYTDCYSMTVLLAKGSHKLTVKHKQGTIVLDSLLVTESGAQTDTSVLPDFDRSTDGVQSYLAVVSEDGYYTLSCDVGTDKILVNDNETTAESGSDIYLMRGLNYIDISSSQSLGAPPTVERAADKDNTQTEYLPSDARLSGGARIRTNDVAECDYIDGISSVSGEAQFTVNAERDGVYAITLTYANNDEGGAHAYNVDLIERYVTVTSNGQSQDVFCRNTYSWDTYKTVTAFVTLKEGENEITLSNSGNNKFNGEDAYAPHISSFTVNEISK